MGIMCTKTFNVSARHQVEIGNALLDCLMVRWITHNFGSNKDSWERGQGRYLLVGILLIVIQTFGSVNPSALTTQLDVR